ncbi:glycosyltransferase [Adlercreutzia sp. ZJ473]|uniref:glycosyltransferase n=1 Tax=Adlercreutzia sp. ZJ473 TaxID=2722822 RepID=UPI001557D2F4|nr:glycosyltransferase [Adlercreutzia sp. ZJ473]
MKPVVIIPTYISATRRRRESREVVGSYDHTTAITQSGELGRCLASLEGVDDLGLVVVLVAADAGLENQAAEKVRAVAAAHPRLSVLVIGAAELALVRQRMEQLNIGRLEDEVGLRGYSAVRNLGLVVAITLGFDAVVFLDDDEVIDDPAFLKNAMYGLGKLTKKGIPILAKTGYYLNDQGSYLSKWEDKWYNRFWQQGRAFNAWISRAMQGPRLSRSNHVCGGCLAIHKEAFKRLAFDPWITRGEDLDYMLNLRMYGSDIWFDNRWVLRHLPPETQSEGDRFRQDIFRWIYEYRKLEYSRALIDLQQVKPASLEPYPGPFLEPGLTRRIRLTALLRSLARPDKRAYRRAAKAATGEASAYAEANCAKYFEFQYVWPEAMARLDSDQMLTTALVRSCLMEPVGGAAGDVGGGAAAGGAAARAVGAGAPVAAPSTSVDPGLTCEIRLNIAE